MRAAWRAHGRPEGRHAFVELVVPTTLERSRNNVGSTDDADYDAGDFDGVGNTYSRQALAAAGLPPGAEVVVDGVRFTWPDLPAGAPDNVLAAGQTIVLSGAGAVLGFLGSTSRGPITRAATLHYEDGSSAEVSLTLDDYFNPARPGSGNEAVATMPYINTTNPARADNGIGGRRTEEVYVFYAPVPVEPGKRVAGVTLPAVDSTVEGGRPAMHIFAVGIG